MKQNSHPAMQSLGPHLRQLREKRKLSLRQLANAIGISHQYIGRLETGDYRQPSPEVLQKLAKALEVPYDNLFTLAGYLLPQNLPSLGPYLRRKYHATADEVEKVAKYLGTTRPELANELINEPEDEPMPPDSLKG